MFKKSFHNFLILLFLRYLRPATFSKKISKKSPPHIKRIKKCISVQLQFKNERRKKIKLNTITENNLECFGTHAEILRHRHR